MGCCITLLTGKVERKTGMDVIKSSGLLTESIAKSTWRFTPPTENQARYPLYKRFQERKAQRPYKTGDIVAFATYDGDSAVSNFFRRVAKATTSTPYTHVALVVIMKETQADGSTIDMEYMLEATTNPCKTIDATNGSGTKRNGTWCFAMVERICTDPAELWHIPLKTALTQEQETKLIKWASDMYVKDPTFDKDSMFGAGFDAFDKMGMENDEELTMLFCSEFASSCYKAAGILDQNLNCSEVTPAECCGFDILDSDDTFQLKLPNEHSEHE